MLTGLERAEPARDEDTGRVLGRTSNGGQSAYAAALEEAGLTRQEANRWQKVAAFDEGELAALKESCRDRREEA